MGRYYQAGKCPPRDVMFKGEEKVCEVTPHWEAAGSKDPPQPATPLSPLPHTAGNGSLGLSAPATWSNRRGRVGIIKHNPNAVKNLAATQAVPGDNVDEGSSPEPPAKKAKQPAKAGGWRAGPGAGWCRAQGAWWGVRVAGRPPDRRSRCRHPGAACRPPRRSRPKPDVNNLFRPPTAARLAAQYRAPAHWMCRARAIAE
eukprot:jgi/Tetstr1/431789/TSEL_021284.t1